MRREWRHVGWESIDRLVTRLGSVVPVTRAETVLYVYVEGSYSAAGHPAAECLVRHPAGCVGALVPGLPRTRHGLFRVLDPRQLLGAVHALGEYGFASVIGGGAGLEARLVRAAVLAPLGATTPGRASALVGLAGVDQACFEVSTNLDGGVDDLGTDGSYLVITYRLGLPADVVAALDSVPSGHPPAAPPSGG